jgi:Pyruvate/2-oxoacid:ferredoxin oxidoreductase gamma subunit
MALVGAASPLMPVSSEGLEGEIRSLFSGKGGAVVEANLAAFRMGRDARN